nr:zinc finger protein 62-like [Misgurnus anguillicaudatus]
MTEQKEDLSSNKLIQILFYIDVNIGRSPQLETICLIITDTALSESPFLYVSCCSWSLTMSALKRNYKCFVLGCTNEHQSLYRLPQSESQRTSWLDFIFYGNVPKKVPRLLHVCANHFTPDCFKNERQFNAGLSTSLILNNESIPTLRSQTVKSEQDVSGVSVCGITDQTSTELLVSVCNGKEEKISVNLLDCGIKLKQEITEEEEQTDEGDRIQSDLNVKLESFQSNNMEEKPHRFIPGEESLSCLKTENLSDNDFCTCSRCGKIFNSQSDLKAHMQNHTKERPYSCDQCGKTFTQKPNLNMHKKIHTGERPYSCDQCGKTFTQKGNLNMHKKIHTGERPYRCDQCEQTFYYKHKLIAHKRIHTGEKPYSCDLCEKSFAFKFNLDVHRRTHTGEKPYRCDLCGQSFNYKFYLAVHRRIHTGEKPYSCDQCKKSFAFSCHLSVHKKVHNREKLYSCDQCGQTFGFKSHLTEHRIIHTREKPYSCDQCGQTFIRRFRLDMHKETHIGEKHYSCDQCGETFIRRFRLDAHKRIHAEEKQEVLPTTGYDLLYDHRCSPKSPSFLYVRCSSWNLTMSALKRNYKCFVLGCTNEHQSLYTLPQSESLRASWLDFIFYGNVPKKVPRMLHVCANHFTPDCFKNERQFNAGFSTSLILNNESIPTLRSQTVKSEQDVSGVSVCGIIDHTSTELLVSVCNKEEEKKNLLDCGMKTNEGDLIYSDLNVKLESFQSNDTEMKPDNFIPGEESLNCLKTEILSDNDFCTCSRCGKIFNSQSDLKAHIQIHAEKRPYSCDQCGKTFTQKASLNMHKKIHTGEKPYRCDQCGKCFTQKANLNMHKKIHTGEKPYSCDQCEQTFLYKSKLIGHKRIHTGEKPYGCDLCGQTFNYKSYLAVHRRIHTGEKPYSCDQCGRTFTFSCHLTAHRKIHNRVKPYSCDQCGQTFGFKSHLTEHRIIHTEEKPYSCDQCGQTFIRRFRLNVHKRIHTGEKPLLSQTQSPSFLYLRCCSWNLTMSALKRNYKCGVLGCTNEHQSLYRLPQSESLWTSWLDFIFCGNIPKKVPRLLHVCANHFTPDCFKNESQFNAGFSTSLILNNESIPTLRSQTVKSEDVSGVSVCGITDQTSTELLVSVCKEEKTSVNLLDCGMKTNEGDLIHSDLNVKLESFLSNNMEENPHRFIPGEDSLSCLKTEILSDNDLCTCSRCGKIFNSQSDLRAHMQIHTEERPYSCDQCGKTFTQKGSLNVHKKIHTGERPYRCDQCGKSFLYKSIFIVHKRIHTGVKPYGCDLCKQTFTRKYGLDVHRRTHTGEKPYSCDLCEKSFASKVNLDVHRRTHTGERPYGCDLCGQTFNYKFYLAVHRRIHTGEKPYSCDQCGRTFTFSCHLTLHRKSHNRENPYSCDQCGETFGFKSDLIEHRRIHTREKPYSCDQCGETFIRRFRLDMHKRIHTGEKPYGCDLCGETFGFKSHLTEHRRIHTREKPYSCDQCGETFIRRFRLDVHKRIHAEEKP